MPLPQEFFLEESLHHYHHPGEIERYYAAKNAESDEEWHTFHQKRLTLGKEEFKIVAGEDIGHRGGCDRGYQQRHHSDCGEIEHQHLECEKHARDRSLENTGDARRCSATHKNHKNSGRKSECLADIGAYGGSGEDDRTYRTAEADGDRRSNHRRVHVVWLKSALVLRNGV